MNKGEKYVLWYSTYQQSLGEFLRDKLTEREKEVFHMLWVGYAVPMKLKSAYFELLRVGDGKYTLNVQKYTDGKHSVKFIIKNNYANTLERFTN